MELKDVDISKYHVEFCDHCQRHVVAHDGCSVATCSGGALCSLCEGGYVLEANYTYIQLFQFLKYAN